ncbi:transcription factor bHLH130-like [Lotus japonicus]|uniref:transcription factor bHLH130-like n=1 Tax=Lotus japonicus TaxID=34305 RepID=UPI00258F7099|nr:transcription factor bHLH130-like [Lotus japonicus]
MKVMDDIGETCPDDGRQGGSTGDARHYVHRFLYGSWNNTAQLSEHFSGLKRGQSGNEKMFSDVQNGELGSQVHTLSFTKNFSSLIAMEKLLQSQISKIRANEVVLVIFKALPK